MYFLRQKARWYVQKKKAATGNLWSGMFTFLSWREKKGGRKNKNFVGEIFFFIWIQVLVFAFHSIIIYVEL